jgi:hypothetical protein
VSVTVRRYATTGVTTPQSGATVAYEGLQATTDEHGEATLVFAHAGVAAVDVSAPGSVRDETTVCVHAGDDGTCGTSAAAPGAPKALPSAGGEVLGLTSAPYRGPFALVADVSDVSDGHVYDRAHAPRLLAGKVSSHSSVSSLSLKLRRRFDGLCYAFDGVSARFRRARCGHASFFKVSDGATFSYLLPAQLGPGRYVLDVEGTDAAGNHLTLARGTSRLVFYVRR